MAKVVEDIIAVEESGRVVCTSADIPNDLERSRCLEPLQAPRSSFERALE
jgi:hypothetical protein